MVIRGREAKRGRGRGRNPPEPSPGVWNDQNKRQKLGIDDTLKHKQNYTSDSEETNEYYPSDDIEDEGVNCQSADANNVKKCKGVSFGFSNNMRQSSRGIRNGKGRGRSDPLEPSRSCTSPAPPPPHMSFSPEPSNYNGWRSAHSTLYGRVDKRQNHGLTGADGYNARKGVKIDRKQGLAGNDEYYVYNDSEDEGMQHIQEKQNQKQANSARKGTEGSLGVSNNEKMSGATLGSFPQSTALWLF